MKPSTPITPAELLSILEDTRRLVVTAENIEAVRQITRDDRITLRRRHNAKDKSVKQNYGIANHLIDVPKSVEPQIGDFLHINDMPMPKKPSKKKK